MKKHIGDPFMPPDEYGKSLTGFTLNILVRDMAQAVQFHRTVLQVEFVYSDPDISIIEAYGVRWMLHSDHTYDKHPLWGHTQDAQKRGVGAEFRLHGLDPDQAELAARDLGCTILSPARDQPDHGLREVHILDADGYCWVADVPLPD